MTAHLTLVELIEQEYLVLIHLFYLLQIIGLNYCN